MNSHTFSFAPVRTSSRTHFLLRTVVLCKHIAITFLNSFSNSHLIKWMCTVLHVFSKLLHLSKDYCQNLKPTSVQTEKKFQVFAKKSFWLTVDEELHKRWTTAQLHLYVRLLSLFSIMKSAFTFILFSWIVSTILCPLFSELWQRESNFYSWPTIPFNSTLQTYNHSGLWGTNPKRINWVLVETVTAW